MRIYLAGKWQATTYIREEHLNVTDHPSSKPMVWADGPPLIEGGEESLDNLRLLTRSPNNISPRDISLFWTSFSGSVNTTEYMFSLDLIQTESDTSIGEDVFPVLATALRAFGEGSSEWERFLRLLLRKRSSLHSPVLRTVRYEYEDYLIRMLPCKLLEYGTPLDELFLTTRTPLEGEAIASRWLQILSSEGIDVVAYLKEEYALHEQQMQLTIGSRCR